MDEPKTTGQTKNTGFEIGVRNTFHVSNEKVWDFLFSDKGIQIWLGKLVSGKLEINNEFVTTNGISGTVKVFKPGSHIRLTWKKKDWNNISTLQIRTISLLDKTTISFHQERLLNYLQRIEMKDFWTNILKELSTKLKK